MGQYFHIVNPKTKECVKPHDYNNGTKLMEFSYVGNYVMNAVTTLLRKQWKNQRIVFSGDYADEDYYETCNKNLHIKEFDSDYRYFINLDKKEYFDITKCKQDEWRYIIHPLAILLANSNSQGGGDYYGVNKDLAGEWVNDRISCSNHRPKKNRGYLEIIPNFEEK